MTYELTEKQKAISFVAHGSPTVVLSAVGMLMYPELLAPKLNELSGKMKFGCLLVFRKDYAETNGWKTVAPAAVDAALHKVNLTLAGLAAYPTFKYPHTDGADKKYLKKDANKQPIPGDFRPGFGPDVFTIKSEANPDRAPKLLGADNVVITDPARIKELFYGGALVRAMFNAYPSGWNPAYPNKSVNFGLTALQFVHPGQKRYDGAPNVEAAFGAIPVEDMAGGFPAPGTAPAAPVHPVGALFATSAPAATGFPAPGGAPGFPTY